MVPEAVIGFTERVTIAPSARVSPSAVAVGPAHDVASAFVEHGYLVVPGLVGLDDIARVNAELPAFARGDYPALNPIDLPDGCSDDEAVDHLLAIHFPHWVSPVVLELVHHGGVCDVIAQIAAAHLPEWDGSAKCMQSMLFVKPAGYQGQAWHQDEHYIPTRDRSLVGAWIALDDATIENGCLWVLPGSHRSGYLWPVRSHDDPEQFDGAQQAYGFEEKFPESEAVPMEVNAGDVVFFNGYLLHRSLKNRTFGRRRALVNHYMSSWSPLHWDLLGGFAKEDFRAVVPVTGVDPYAHLGYGEPWDKVYLRPRT